jgi:toxin HigB-1
VIRSFHDRGTADVFDGKDTRAARRACAPPLWRVARRKLDQLNAVTSRESLRVPPGNRWEKLEGDRDGQGAIRINDQFRICYAWTPDGPAWVEITDYH